MKMRSGRRAFAGRMRANDYSRKKRGGRSWLLTAILVAGGVMGILTPAASAAAPRFQGRVLVVVSDGDMIPSAYIDGSLGPAAPDLLTVVRLDQEVPAVSGQVAVSNSVAGPPASVAVSPDGRYAVVIETLGHRPALSRAPRIEDLPSGSRMAVIDLADRSRPTVVQTIATSPVPESVAFAPDGLTVSVSFKGGRGVPPISLYRFRSGRLSPAQQPVVPGWEEGDQMIDADFHPSRPILALLNATKSNLRLVEMRMGKGDRIGLRSLGKPIAVEPSSFLARFSPDGRHVLVNSGYAAYGYNLNDSAQPRGTVSSFRVVIDGLTGSTPGLRLVSRATTGVIPEGLSISPNGHWVATANLERSVAAASDPDMRRYSSVSLLRMDPASGLLERATEIALDGALPETVVFDNESRFIAATIFSQFDTTTGPGEVVFLRIEQDPYEPRRTELVKTRGSLEIPRGAHSMVIVR